MDWENDIEECLKVLQGGGIILYPTETGWGIGCDATNETAVNKIVGLQEGGRDDRMVVLVADEREVLKYAASPDLALFDYLQLSRHPVAVIYEGAIGLADNLLEEDGSVTIRICNDPFCRHLIRRFRKPVVYATAAFKSEVKPVLFNEINDLVKSGVDYVVLFGQNEFDIFCPAQLIKWVSGKAEVIRHN
ncbi:MAG TPA: Sua5/YciO/YrdC/YwlC family protein [Chitinophagaceae bacterium]|nr:Sua5/YciO/YrdC/YwlC family protein [Chitinophagaceae bacterium]